MGLTKNTSIIGLGLMCSMFYFENIVLAQEGGTVTVPGLGTVKIGETPVDRDRNGEDVPGIRRYPGSVRVSSDRVTDGQIRDTRGDAILYKGKIQRALYETDDRYTRVVDYYEDELKRSDWRVEIRDLGNSTSRWVCSLRDSRDPVYLQVLVKRSDRFTEIEYTRWIADGITIRTGPGGIDLGGIRVSTDPPRSDRDDHRASQTITLPDGTRVTSEDIGRILNSRGAFTLSALYFDTNSARIKPESYPLLNLVGGVLEGEPSITGRIEGHTDNTGNRKFNMELSQLRAESVRAYLISNFKITPYRITAVGYGPTKPISSNTSEAGRAQNRRVDLVRTDNR